MQLIQGLLEHPFMSPQLMLLPMVRGGKQGKIQVRLDFFHRFIVVFLFYSEFILNFATKSRLL